MNQSPAKNGLVAVAQRFRSAVKPAGHLANRLVVKRYWRAAFAVRVNGWVVPNT